MIVQITAVIPVSGQPNPPVYLAGWDPVANIPWQRFGARDLKVRETRSGQVVQLFRSPTVANFDRLNRQVSLSFSVIRNFPTVGASQNWMLLHPSMVPTSGTVQFTADAGGVMTVFYLPGATVNSVEGWQEGATCHHTYQITAPAIQTIPP